MYWKEKPYDLTRSCPKYPLTTVDQGTFWKSAEPKTLHGSYPCNFLFFFFNRLERLSEIFSNTSLSAVRNTDIQYYAVQLNTMEESCTMTLLEGKVLRPASFQSLYTGRNNSLVEKTYNSHLCTDIQN